MREPSRVAAGDRCSRGSRDIPAHWGNPRFCSLKHKTRPMWPKSRRRDIPADAVRGSLHSEREIQKMAPWIQTNPTFAQPRVTRQGYRPAASCSRICAGTRSSSSATVPSAAADLLEHYRELVRGRVALFGGAEIRTEGDSFYVVFDSVSQAVRCGLAIVEGAANASDARPDRRFASVSGSMQARRSRPPTATSGVRSTSPRDSVQLLAPARFSSATPSAP